MLCRANRIFCWTTRRWAGSFTLSSRQSNVASSRNRTSTMKLTEKYELLEIVSSGRVSTFIARERNSHEQVVVHTFECPGANLPSNTAAILIRFGALAPNPPGDVLKAGLDEVSSSAFIVTKMPAQAALQDWVRAYRFFPEAKTPVVADPVVEPRLVSEPTIELSAEKVNEILGRGAPRISSPAAESSNPPSLPVPETPRAENPAPALQHSAGEFTQMFRDLGAFQSQAGGQPGENTKAAPSGNSIPTGMFEIPALREQPPVAQAHLQSNPPEAGEFTRQFFSAPKSGTGDGVGKSISPPAAKSEPQEPGSFTQQFSISADVEKQRTIPDANPPSNRATAKNNPPAPPIFEPIPNSRFEPNPAEFNSSKPVFSGSGEATSFGSSPEQTPEKSSGGEFTSFFSGPFDQPGSSKPIAVPDQVPVSPKQQEGDFTRVFGKGTGFDPEEYRTAKTPEPASPSSGSFTQIFGASDLGGKLGVSSQLDPQPPASAPSSMFGSAPTPPEPSSTFPDRTPIAPSLQPPPYKPASPQPGPFSGDSFPPSKPVNVPSRAAENAFMNRAGNSDATDVFRVPGASEPPPLRDMPSGPSEFTVFLSRSQVNASLPQEPAMAPPSPPPPAPPQPSPFSFAPLQMPAAPKPPAMQFPPRPAMPPPPQLAMPPVPAPRPPAPPKSAPSSFWPLVTVLSVLIFIAILLVMYFALKH